MEIDPHTLQELQARIDRALYAYREHPDYEDLRQEAWLRLLQVFGNPRYPDLRRIAARTARWAALDYVREGHGLDADWKGIGSEGFRMFSTFDLPPSFHPSERDFAPALIDAIAWRQAVRFHVLPPLDKALLWQVGAMGRSLRAVAREWDVPYNTARDRYLQAIRFCRAERKRVAPRRGRRRLMREEANGVSH